MKATALLLLPTLAVTNGSPVDLSTKYEKGVVYDVAIESETSSETVSSEMTMDGEPIDRGGRGMGGGGRTTSISVEYSDTIVAATNGVPTKVERSFGSVGGDMMMEMRDDVMEMDRTSAFDGITLVLTKGEDGLVEVEVTDGDAPEDERLEGHALTLPLDGLLPQDDETDEWEIEGEALLLALGVDAGSKLLDRPERGGGEGRGGEGRGGRGRGGMRGGQGGGANPLAAGEWDITATRTDEVEDFDGVEARKITIDAEVEGTLPERERRRRDFAAGAPEASSANLPENTISGSFEGTLWWSDAQNRPVKFEFEGSYETTSEGSRESERGSFEWRRVQETSIDVSVEVGMRKAESDD